MEVPLPAAYSIELFQITDEMSLPNGYLSEYSTDGEIVHIFGRSLFVEVKVSGFEFQPGHIFALMEKCYSY